MQKVIFKFLLFTFWVGFNTSLFSQSKPTESELIKADSLYANKQYTESLKIYNNLFKADIYSPAMLLKMARIAEGQSKFGLSNYYLEKYFILTGDKVVLDHIQKIASQENLSGFDFKFEYFVNHYYKKYSPFLSILLSIAVLVLVLSLVLKSQAKNKLKPIALLAIILAAVALVLNNYKANQFAIIATTPSLMMNAPSSASDVIHQFDKASRIRIQGTKDKWTRTQIEDKVGYLSSDHLKKL